MPPLRMYATSALEDMSRDVRRRRADKVMSDVDLALLLARCVLREQGGAYLYFDPRDASWARWNGETWHPSAAPRGPLAGEDGLPVPIPRPEVPAEEAIEASEVVSASEALAQIRHTVHEAYWDGRIDSEAAAVLMARQVLVDLGGTVWTVGFATGRWYRAESGRWQPFASPPTDDDLYGREELASLLENPTEDQDIPDSLAEFLVAGVGVLPEAIEAPWAPPETVPASAMQLYRTCPTCGAMVTAESRFCNVCGASRPEPTRPSDKAADTEQPMRRCSQCGAPVAPGQAFCMRCGAALLETARCLACGAERPPGARFCPECGAALEPGA